MGEGEEKDDFALVYERFFFKEPDHLFVAIDNSTIISSDLQQLRKVSKDNVLAAIDIGSLPFLMASSAVQHLSLNRILTAERIRELTPESGSYLDRERELIVWKRASEKHKAFVETSDGINYFRVSVMRELKSALDAPDFNRASSELLGQTIVMIWGAFETLASDLFKLVLNRLPQLANNVVKESKPVFSATVSLDDLSSHGFNMQAQMGDFLLKGRGLDSLVVIRSAYKAIFPNEAALQELLKGSDLWVLWQRRHLIVHRRGLIDDNYLLKTGETGQEVGRRLLIDSGYIDPILYKVCSITVGLLTASDALIENF